MTHSFTCQTRDPANPTGPKIEVVLPSDLIIHFFKFLPVKYQNFETAKQVLDDPKRIFSGIRSLNVGGWCYVGRPAQWYVSENVIVTFPQDKVFVVYLNQGKKIYEYRAEPIDPEDAFSPKGWKDRFGGLVWKNIH